MMAQERGLVLRIERSSIHDGAGLRTVVFLKGCPLRCAWCSTPESQAADIEQAGEQVYGRWFSLDELVQELSKDEVFYFHSGGGVTFSGGEPFCQPQFLQQVMRAIKSLGINVAVESCLAVPFSQIAPCLPDIDTFFADLKLVDAQRHRLYCGGAHATIIHNLRCLGAWQWPLRLVVRMPMIPGVNDDEANLAAAADLCASLHNLKTVELLPYHRLGVPTYAKLGREYRLSQIKTPSAAHMLERKRFLAQRLPGVEVI